MSDLISRKAILKNIEKIRQGVQMMDDTHRASIIMNGMYLCEKTVRNQPSAQPEYEPAKLEDFAKTMSANTLYSFMAWYGEGLELMERHGFVICKKTM